MVFELQGEEGFLAICYGFRKIVILCLRNWDFFEEFCLYIGHFLHLSEIISLKWHERKLEIAFAFHFHNYLDM